VVALLVGVAITATFITPANPTVIGRGDRRPARCRHQLT